MSQISEQSSVITYRPNGRSTVGPFAAFNAMIRNIRGSRGMIWQLFKRDFLAAHKKSFLGFFWAVAPPLVAVLSWVFMQMTGVLTPGDVGVPYPVYVLIGSSVWSLFMSICKAAGSTLTGGSGLLSQVRYPHEAILAKEVMQALAQFAIVFTMNIVVMIFFRVLPAWQIVFFPLTLVPLILLAASIGLIVALVSGVTADLSNLVNLLLGFLLYLSPIIYSSDIKSGLLHSVISSNPLTYLICSSRDILLYGRLYDTNGFAICSAVSVLLFIFCWRFFYISEEKVVERML